ncbi:shikimate dehydrogenase [Actomonas aquatica]|uniref:Shikimate dehydrogenase (NADP(+)) n=1 Tax=Actomonas aquatica TaxID=2866162 RepID=A0ABZ1CDY6_9BACT|nr:shikimate dehydrogenase [Opitutus sp. WL0086]WRQ89826.1 shikimate dehydrogenase [Opitutus sp. WL0086]
MEPVYTLADLDTWSHRGTALAVLGHPIKHSISPPMHNAALAVMAQDHPTYGDWRYFRFDVPPADLPLALNRLHAAGFHGLNLTVPHKVLACDTIAHVDPSARPIGAVNTLRRTTNGWHGFNTDGYGLATAVTETLGIQISGTPVILLGAGGAARGAAVECLARGCASLHIANRTAANRDALLTALAPLAGDIPLHGFAPAEPPADLPVGALLINATSAGLHPEDPLPIDLAALPTPAGVYDMIYNPAESALLAQARERGLPHANGLSMLIHQGARALEIWTDTPVPVDAMRQAVQAAL